VAEEEKEGGKKKEPKGGVKHTPGRGHRRKSDPQRKKRFKKNVVKRKKELQEALRQQWDEWNALGPEVRKFFPELKPKLPRPEDES